VLYRHWNGGTEKNNELTSLGVQAEIRKRHHFSTNQKHYRSAHQHTIGPRLRQNHFLSVEEQKTPVPRTAPTNATVRGAEVSLADVNRLSAGHRTKRASFPDEALYIRYSDRGTKLPTHLYLASKFTRWFKYDRDKL
jgi:hypothetical protein